VYPRRAESAFERHVRLHDEGERRLGMKLKRHWMVCGLLAFLTAECSLAQTPHRAPPPHNTRLSSKPSVEGEPRPKLVVLLVVDQMRGDYVDRFMGQWTGGLKRLVEEGAWFREAAYSYAATETCVGHATISTGAFPATHGMIANAWWDRDWQRLATCTADPNAKNRQGSPAMVIAAERGRAGLRGLQHRCDQPAVRPDEA